MVGIAFGDLAGLGPDADHLRLLVHQAFQRPLQLVLDMRRSLQNLVCEQPAFSREIARHLELPADIASDLRFRIAFRIEGSERLQPVEEHPVDQRPVHGLLGAEIIEQVGFRHAGHFGDLVDGRAAKAPGGKYIEGRLKNLFFLFFLNTCAPLGLRCSRNGHLALVSPWNSIVSPKRLTLPSF